ncbi:MAG: hydroxymethylbilane synthase [Myxococcales bacterium]|nr:hydroxymethylbilane synthase [Myxococcales bacterium]
MRIGTRGSPLALVQAHEVRERLELAWPSLRGQIQVIVIDTKGDQILDKPLAEIGGKGLFTEELEAQLRDGRVDIAVHSMKDMPTQLPAGLHIGCLLTREDPRDVLLSRGGLRLEQLPKGAVIGTASLRRRSQVLHLRPDLNVVTFRGNVQTRIRKLEQGHADATLLALAGLKRLGLESAATEIFDPSDFVPAVAQGAIGVECRVGDSDVQGYLNAIHCTETEICLRAERSMLAALDGSCRTPIAGHAVLTGDVVTLSGMLDAGQGVIRASESSVAADAAELGLRLAAKLKGLCR